MGSDLTKRIMIAASVCSVLGFAISSHPAEARPSTQSYTCQGVQNLIQQRGAVVMNFKGNSLYRRFVNSLRYCSFPDNRLKRMAVPTKTGKCQLYVCYEADFFRD